jgi:hypothetical protein
MRLTRKEARGLGIKEEAAERKERPAISHKEGSYAWACSQGWHLATTGARGEFVYAWKVQAGRVLRTATLPCGAGDDLGAHYRPACAAVARKEWTEERQCGLGRPRKGT